MALCYRRKPYNRETGWNHGKLYFDFSFKAELNLPEQVRIIRKKGQGDRAKMDLGGDIIFLRI